MDPRLPYALGALAWFARMQRMRQRPARRRARSQT